MRNGRVVEVAATQEIFANQQHPAVLKRCQFGQSSERLAAEIEQLELRLEELEESRAEQSAQQPQAAPPATGPSKSRKPALRKPLPPHLPRESVVHEPEVICVCQQCDRSKLARLGEDVTEVLEKSPARTAFRDGPGAARLWLELMRNNDVQAALQHAPDRRHGPTGTASMPPPLWLDTATAAVRAGASGVQGRAAPAVWNAVLGY